MSYTKIEIYSDTSRNHDEQRELENQMEFCFPACYEKTRNLLAAAYRFSNKKGLFISDKKRLENVGKAIIALDIALDIDKHNIMPVEYSLEMMNESKKDRIIWFLNIYSFTFPNNQSEYSMLNIIFDNLEPNFFEHGRQLFDRGL